MLQEELIREIPEPKTVLVLCYNYVQAERHCRDFITYLVQHKFKYIALPHKLIIEVLNCTFIFKSQSDDMKLRGIRPNVTLNWTNK